jgi:peptidyl-prolyl cis-trans isomerase SurA
MFRARNWIVAGAVALGIAAGPRDAEATIVERVVAIVGERPILLSELRLRARPFRHRIAAETQDPTQQAGLESKMYKELLNRMIDERLEEQAADKAHVVVTPEEVDAGIRNISTQARLTPKQLVAEAKRQGLTEQDYRDEIRRQVLEGKLTQLRVRGRVNVTDQDGRAAYDHLVKEMTEQSPVDVRILALRIPQGSPPETVAARKALAEDIVRRGRAGEDFCKMVELYTDDGGTRTSCGSRGPQPLTQFFPQLQEVIKGLAEGQIGDPVPFQGEAILILQVASVIKPPPYAKVRDQMMERAAIEATEHQKQNWLKELRRGVHIETRL